MVYTSIMDSLSDLLAGRTPQQPPEVDIIKAYVLKAFDEQVDVRVLANRISIVVPNGALASALRGHLFQLREILKTDKDITIRIGSASS
jgi:hypothetical protein